MKKTILILLSLLLLTTATVAQTDTLSLKELEIPNSPAFILLDQTPSVIERPASSKAFVLSILNSFQNNNGIPQNYAVEFTPFWFFKHPEMSSLKYAGYNAEKQRQMIFENIKRASISLAYVNSSDTATLRTINNISAGIRFNLITVRSKKDIETIINTNSDLINFMRTYDDSLEAYMDKYYPNVEEENPTLYHIAVKEFYERYGNNKKEKEVSIKDILAWKPVFAVDGAIGYNSFFIDNCIKDYHFGRFGAWLTFNYSCHLGKDKNSGKYFNLYAIGRYLSDGTALHNGKYSIANYYDFGGKAELEFSRLSVAFEYVYRLNNNINTFRANGLVKYKVSDQVYLTCSFGKNFGEINNLIALFGLNWGLSTGYEKATVK